MSKLKNRIDKKAGELLKLQGEAASLQDVIHKKRAALVAIVDKHGNVGRGHKTKVLRGERYVLKLSKRLEVSIDAAVVKRIEKVCPPTLFSLLFERVDSYSLRSESHKWINGKLPEAAPPNLRSLFARSIVSRALTPALYVDPIDDHRQGPKEEHA